MSAIRTTSYYIRCDICMMYLKTFEPLPMGAQRIAKDDGWCCRENGFIHNKERIFDVCPECAKERGLK